MGKEAVKSMKRYEKGTRVTAAEAGFLSL